MHIVYRIHRQYFDFMVKLLKNKLFTDQQGRLNARIFRNVINLYPPLLGAGIRVVKVADDYGYLRVELANSKLTSNYVGTQFGGSIYMMTDPFYMVMFMQKLGSGYIVWDKAATIDFVHPGRSRLVAEFNLTEFEVEEVRARAASGDKVLYDKEVLIKDADGELVAKVMKTIYIRKKK